MDFWLLSLVLISLLIGWIIGRWRPAKESLSLRQSDKYTETYVKGLNYLLSDESQKAIEIFTELIEVNSATIEIHIALGNLFRSKGEVDRAIKVHQSLLARPNLSRKQRNLAIAELANDYLKAGLLDRAEKLFKEMIQLRSDDLVAYQRLLDLYITEKSWYEAVECAQELYNRDGANAKVVLSQCLCEIAEAELKQGNTKIARESLSRALEVDQSCVRAALLLIRLQVADGNYSGAKKLFNRLVKLSPEFMELYIEPAQIVYLRGNNTSEYQKFLQQQYQQHPSTRLALALLEHYASTNQIENSRQFLSDVLKSSPSFESFDFALKFLKSDPEQLSETWERLSLFINQVQSKKVEFVCSQCGYGSHTIQWCCPSCRNWASMKPI